MQSWLDGYLARQGAASASSPQAAAEPTAEASQLTQQQSILDASQSEAALHAKHGSSLACQKSGALSGSGLGSTANDPVKCPEALEGVRDFIWRLFEKFVDPLLDWLLAHGATLLPVAPQALMSAVTVLFETQAAAIRWVSDGCAHFGAASPGGLV